jgi:hypothetical protein
MRRFALPLLSLAACSSGSFPAIDQVTGLTVLAIKAEPPDQLVVYDGGVFALALSSDTPFNASFIADVRPISAITATALVADPGGNGRAIQAVFATCAQLDATSHQCLPGSPDYTVIGSGAYFPDAGPAIVAGATFTPSQQLLDDALALDPLHGFGYLPLPLQVTVNAGDDQAVGVKTLTFSQPVVFLESLDDAGVRVVQPAGVNPEVSELKIDSADWNADAGSPIIGDDVTIMPALEEGYTYYLPQPDGGWMPSTDYLVPALDGGLIAFTDYWSYEFYCTAGSFSEPRTGGGPRAGLGNLGGLRDAGTTFFNDAGEILPGTWVQWSADAGVPSQLVYYWIVVLDGRGGVDFAQRTARYQAP